MDIKSFNLNEQLLDHKISFQIENQEIQVIQYLPINEKLKLISTIINKTIDENNFFNPVKLEVIAIMEIIKAYTDIEFDEEEKNIEEYYDLLESNGILDKIIKTIPELEFNFITESLDTVVKNVYEYKNSIFGILDTLSTNYSQLKFDSQKIYDNLSNPENLKLLKEIMQKLG